MDSKTLASAMNIPIARAEKWADAITAGMAAGKIVTRLAVAAFLAQIGHESGGLVYTKEIGGASYFSRYEGREDLGNTQPGDGAKFCGRGLIQVTGRANYRRCSAALFGDERLLATPDLLEKPEHAVRSAVWYWTKHNLNALADADRFTDLTRAINGGTNGLADRKERYKLALSVLK
ncbi:MAG: glycoside hydrolase family 19 protein [Pseudomonas sp.]